MAAIRDPRSGQTVGEPRVGAAPPGSSLRGLMLILVVDVACPYLAYRLLTQYLPGISTTAALGLAGVFPDLSSRDRDGVG